MRWRGLLLCLVLVTAATAVLGTRSSSDAQARSTSDTDATALATTTFGWSGTCNVDDSSRSGSGLTSASAAATAADAFVEDCPEDSATKPPVTNNTTYSWSGTCEVNKETGGNDGYKKASDRDTAADEFEDDCPNDSVTESTITDNTTYSWSGTCAVDKKTGSGEYTTAAARDSAADDFEDDCPDDSVTSSTLTNNTTYSWSGTCAVGGKTGSGEYTTAAARDTAATAFANACPGDSVTSSTLTNNTTYSWSGTCAVDKSTGGNDGYTTAAARDAAATAFANACPSDSVTSSAITNNTTYSWSGTCAVDGSTGGQGGYTKASDRDAAATAFANACPGDSVTSSTLTNNTTYSWAGTCSVDGSTGGQGGYTTAAARDTAATAFVNACPADSGTSKITGTSSPYTWTASCTSGASGSGSSPTVLGAASAASNWITSNCTVSGGITAKATAPKFDWTATCASGGSGSGSAADAVGAGADQTTWTNANCNKSGATIGKATAPKFDWTATCASGGSGSGSAADAVGAGADQTTWTTANCNKSGATVGKATAPKFDWTATCASGGSGSGSATDAVGAGADQTRWTTANCNKSGATVGKGSNPRFDWTATCASGGNGSGFAADAVGAGADQTLWTTANCNKSGATIGKDSDPRFDWTATCASGGNGSGFADDAVGAGADQTLWTTANCNKSGATIGKDSDPRFDWTATCASGGNGSGFADDAVGAGADQTLWATSNCTVTGGEASYDWAAACTFEGGTSSNSGYSTSSAASSAAQSWVTENCEEEASGQGLDISAESLSIEEGDNDTFTVALKTAPTGPVTVTITSGDADTATVSPASLSFTSTTYSTAKTVTVSGVADSDSDDDSVTIALSASGGGYSASGSVSVEVLEPRPKVGAPTGLSTTPGNKSMGLTWTAPTGATAYRIEYREGTSGGWTTAADGHTGTSFDVTGLPKCDPTSYQFRVSAKGDGTTYSKSYGTVATTSGTPRCPPAGHHTLRMAASPETCPIPTADLASTASPSAVKGPRNDYLAGIVEQTFSDGAPVVVTAPADTTTCRFTKFSGDCDDDRESIAPPSDPRKCNINSMSTDKAVTAHYDTHNLLVSKSSLPIAEGESGTFTVKLTTAPTVPVTVPVVSSATGAVTVAPSSLTFSTSSWNTAQEVTVRNVSTGAPKRAPVTVNLSASGGGYDNAVAAVSVVNLSWQAASGDVVTINSEFIDSDGRAMFFRDLRDTGSEACNTEIKWAARAYLDLVVDPTVGSITFDSIQFSSLHLKGKEVAIDHATYTEDDFLWRTLSARYDAPRRNVGHSTEKFSSLLSAGALLAPFAGDPVGIRPIKNQTVYFDPGRIATLKINSYFSTISKPSIGLTTTKDVCHLQAVLNLDFDFKDYYPPKSAPFFSRVVKSETIAGSGIQLIWDPVDANPNAKYKIEYRRTTYTIRLLNRWGRPQGPQDADWDPWQQIGTGPVSTRTPADSPSQLAYDFLDARAGYYYQFRIQAEHDLGRYADESSMQWSSAYPSRGFPVTTAQAAQAFTQPRSQALVYRWPAPTVSLQQPLIGYQVRYRAQASASASSSARFVPSWDALPGQGPLPRDTVWAASSTTSEWTTVNVGLGRSHRITGLTNGTTYEVEVAPRTTQGVGTFYAKTTGVPAASQCESGTAITSASTKPGLVDDCETLLGLKDDLRGTGTLNWSASTAIASWDGLTVSGTPQRVTGVDLSSESLDGSIPAELAWLSSLATLDLSDNSLTGAIPGELGDLSTLTTLDLSDNSLEEEIPEELGDLSSLTTLDLSDNSLTGAIPDDLGDLSSLTTLNLSDNSLTGSIPEELGDLSSLTTLDLSDNSLTGAIPDDLGDLSLTTLRLSGNSGLTGCIPVALESIATNDLSSLSLLYCQPPAPGSLAAATTDQDEVGLSWRAVSNTSKYRVEYRLATETTWTEDSATVAGAAHTVDGLKCETAYLFRVSAFGSGTTYTAAWSDPSATLSVTTSDCTDPVFSSAPYSFSVAEDAASGTAVGTVTATSPGDTLTYTISAGNTSSAFAIDGSTGAITVAGSLDHETTESYTLTVTAEGAKGDSTDATVTVTVTDVDETPSTYSLTTPVSPAGCGTVTAKEKDHTSTPTAASSWTFPQRDDVYVRVSATVADGCTFSYWGLDFGGFIYKLYSNPAQFQLSMDMVVTAHFTGSPTSSSE